MTKYIFITGGVISSLGKGITSASLALLLKSRGYKVVIQKLDPYINVDAGTMNPFQHGEVFVTDDGAETDLDLGHYERFTGNPCDRSSNYTTGRIYNEVIRRERAGDFGGQTVQVVPHITDAIKEAMHGVGRTGPDIAIIEIGGTVGDIESLPFLESVRHMRLELGFSNTVFIHLTLVPYIRTAGEVKTKPSQHSVGKLREIGVQPDFLVCRSDRPLGKPILKKLSLFCNVPEDCVIEEVDVERSIYEVPLALREQDFDVRVLNRLGLELREPDLGEWSRRLKRILEPRHRVSIAVVGKYIALKDSYKSIYEAIVHAGMEHACKVEVEMVDSEEAEKDPKYLSSKLKGVHGILVPGGFGMRGIEGKLEAIRFAREHEVPYFGICYGMQLAVVEFARNVCGLAGATTTENQKDTPHPVISLLEEQRGIKDMGGTMRLGAMPCWLQEGTRAFKAYGEPIIMERHRHRYEFNNKYRAQFSDKGMVFSGLSPDSKLVEIVELTDHPWFVAVQYHPEFKSQVLKPHPLFVEFVRQAMHYKTLNRKRKGSKNGNGND